MKLKNDIIGKPSNACPLMYSCWFTYDRYSIMFLWEFSSIILLSRSLDGGQVSSNMSWAFLRWSLTF